MIWQKAMNLGREIHTITKSFPKTEIYNLTSQICRAVDAIAFNIAKGSIGQSNPDSGNSDNSGDMRFYA